ncbi:maleylpyruvate isomerase N-terminal domain-containing protein [Actinokineospora diospyrosa]|uniref:Mycothiol maleylpyruvate isomerase N-terminal domain-containing protein n=1 Tax=Actinokineospora diospyrosa TaxID=103728 RepID=A0ABT1IN71_9PSEU|nr:maleylpyruvate isomerase N-terminal domain-containing protein [Actinokineospora diospyrosa]MCP2274119.1 Mycothiol maleylpyruvate isomerase N-terminal domain-containing protein [Actinokineospora diospyrosa]
MSTDAFLSAARAALALLRDPAVAAAWDKPSALPEFGVAGLAGHLAYQILVVPEVLADPPPEEPRITLLDHYARAAWIDAGLDGEINIRIRDGGASLAADGSVALADRVEAALDELSATLPGLQARNVRMRLWGSWSLTLDDLLTTRTMELVVHADDLAVSAGIPTPEFTEDATAEVVDLLAALAARRHGPVALIRALSRAERAPSTITAF